MIEKTCLVCNEKYEVHNYMRKSAKYCSRKCSNIGSFSGKKSPNWKGGKNIWNGYVRIRIGGVLTLEHRQVMSEYLGRSLDRKELVHHKNGDRQDNRIKNLQIISTPEHISLHHSGKKSPPTQVKSMISFWKKAKKCGKPIKGWYKRPKGTKCLHLIPCRDHL